VYKKHLIKNSFLIFANNASKQAFTTKTENKRWFYIYSVAIISF